jgi:hypothetical protein
MDHWLSRDYLPSIVFVVIIVVMDHHLKLEVGLGKKIRDGFGTGTRPGSVPAIFSGPVREQISMYVE